MVNTCAIWHLTWGLLPGVKRHPERLHIHVFHIDLFCLVLLLVENPDPWRGYAFKTAMVNEQ